MQYTKKLIFIRLLSFLLFFIFGINILLRDYFDLSWALYVMIGLLVINVLVAIIGVKLIPNIESVLSSKDEKINKTVLMVLVGLWVANFIISSREMDFKLTVHLSISILMMGIAIFGIITQYLVLRRK